MELKNKLESIYSLSFIELESFLINAKEPKFRATQIYKNLHNGVELQSIIGVPNNVKELLANNFYTQLPQVVEERKAKDGTIKYLLKLHDGEVIECVFLVQEYGNTVCISSQVGCKMNCAFCASGKEGFIRDLSAGEILSQVILTKKLNGSLKNIVIMGSGEPLDNYDSTIKFIKNVISPNGLNISARNISLSTVGLVEKLKRLADENLQIHLCVSLHAPNDEIRNQIIPTNKVNGINNIVEQAKNYFNKTKRRVIFEYALIDGVNSQPQHAKELAKLCRGFAVHVNLIMLNQIKGSTLKPVSMDVAKIFLTELCQNNVSATIRKSRGSDIEGACGMLKQRRGNVNDDDERREAQNF
ncbi:MAG: 23S rRNA (adenine(2503)-C(2))-methyltransferase RlmN [Firmicutes bacterium]|nr:23S rRNA (adenine(2503)-C(2))-methyltransferase RlmN [Bacillota bacterium]